LGLLNSIGKYFIYKEQNENAGFILKENKNVDCETAQNAASLDIFDKEEVKGSFIGCAVNDEILKNKISGDIGLNKKIVFTAYDIPKNSDLMHREFNITVKDKTLKAFIVFIDGMTDRTVISNNILQPLMLLSNIKIQEDAKDIGEFIFNRLIAYNQIKKVQNYSDVISNVNFGGCVIFIEGLEYAFMADTKFWDHRGVDAPKSETVIRGPQEAFNEQIRANTALLRKILKDKDLMVQSVSIGKRSNTHVL
jgi:spore germination protein KA